MSKTRVFLADDHAVVREGLKGMVASQPDMEVVGEANDGAVACDRARVILPDVVVMDVTMPGLNGLQASRPRRGYRGSVRGCASLRSRFMKIMRTFTRSSQPGRLDTF
jgi:DNA-binding NarL/FixJ family response regulator